MILRGDGKWIAVRGLRLRGSSLSREANLVIKDLLVWECSNCSELLLEDEVMGRVEESIGRVDEAAELEVVSSAA